MNYEFKLLEYEATDGKDTTTYNSYAPGVDNNKFIVKMFGLNTEGKNACIFVTGFKPFFYVKVNDSWTESDVHELVAYIRTEMGKYYEDTLVKCIFVKKQKLYGFDNKKKYTFIKLKFSSIAGFNKAKKIWFIDTYLYGEFQQRNLRVGGIEFNDTQVEIYESQIPPLLRLFHIQNISPSGWVQLKHNKYKVCQKKSTICDYEFSIKYKDLVSLPDRDTVVPYKILSVDIEASSSHGDFPLPKKDYKKLAVDIVELIKRMELSAQSDNEDNKFVITVEFLRRCILTAFGFDNINGINRVYTKQPTTEDEINELLDKWVHIRPAKHSNNNIATEFSMKGNYSKNNIAIQDPDNLNNNSSDSENDDNIMTDKLELLDTNEGPAENNAETGTFISKKRCKVKAYKKKEARIIEILSDDTCHKDVKVFELAKTFGYFDNKTKNKWEGLFPKIEGDRVTFIGSSLIKYGEKKPYLKHCIVVGTCDEIEGSVVESYSTEREALLAWTKFIQRENPDIMIGYNIHGWDCEFMFRRTQELECERSFLKLSRNREEICIKKDWKTKRESIEENSLYIASGQYDIKYFKMPGRIQIDLLHLFRREHNLSSYKLDYVSGHFISDTINSIEVNDGISTIYTKNLTGLENGDYIIIEEIGHTTDLYANGKKFVIYNKQKDSFDIKTEIHPDKSKMLKWCLGKDDVTPQDIFRLTNKGPTERAIVGKYCIKDTTLVLDLLRKVDTITGYVEMAKLCSVPMIYLGLRGQGIKLTSYLAKKCREKNTLMPVIEKSMDDEGYEGASVLEPRCGLYLDNPIACVDYSSLYPSAIISENLSHDSKVWTKEYDLEGNLLKETGDKDDNGLYIYDNFEGREYVTIKYDTFKWLRKTLKAAKTKELVGYKECRFIQPQNGNRGILPAILEELLAARKRTKKLVKEEKDPFMKNVLDNRQLAIKITANSLYGQCGAKTSTFYEKDVAASTTATGRNLLLYAKKTIEGNFGDSIQTTKNHGMVKTNAECIYGDTDSAFFTFNLRTPEPENKPITGKKALEITIELAQRVSEVANQRDKLKPPHDLEYEKTFMPFILLSKKRYVGMLYEYDIEKCKRKSMGIVLKRRDNAPIVKDVYGGVIDILMNEQIVHKAVCFVKESIEKMINGDYPRDKLIITKSLRSAYKNPQQIAHKVLADRIGEREPGNKPGPGDRIPFIYIKNDNKKALQGDRIENPKYIVEHNIPIDYGIYITNQIMKPLQQLFALVLEEMNDFIIKRGKSLRTWHEDIKKLKEKWPDEEKYKKKYEEFRNKEVKSILFDQYIKLLK